MMVVLVEVLVVLFLAITNGVFAMSEMAMVSARKPRLQQAAEEGNGGAASALRLAQHPGTFLSTVQIGITLIGVLAGAFGGATLSRTLADWLATIEPIAPFSQALSVLMVVGLITYLSLVIGELVPKRIALNNPERVASAVAPPMTLLARLSYPVVRVLNVSSEAILRLLGVSPSGEPPVTEEEIRILIEQGTASGVFEPIEEELVERVFRLGDRSIRAVMTPRSDILWLDASLPEDQIVRTGVASGYSRLPVARGTLDEVIGVAKVRELLRQRLEGEPIDLQRAMEPALFVPESMPALSVLERYRAAGTPLALIIDEYGGLEGLVTIEDIVGDLLGDIPEAGEPAEPAAFQRDDGSWLVDGLFPLDDFQELFDLKPSAVEMERYYQTVGGLVMGLLGRLPEVGDQVFWQDLRLVVVDMDGRRVDKVEVKPPPASGEGQ
jgi:putative hemolysin